MTKTMIFLIDGTANDATVDTFSNVYAINQIISDHRRVRMGKTGRFKHRTQIPSICRASEPNSRYDDLREEY
jgi:hypothetical protein